MKHAPLQIVLIVIFVLLVPLMSHAQSTSAWSYLLVVPDDEEAEFLPYVIQIPTDPVPMGLVFPFSGELFLYAPDSQGLNGQNVPIQPHGQTSGYYFERPGASDNTRLDCGQFPEESVQGPITCTSPSTNETDDPDGVSVNPSYRASDGIPFRAHVDAIVIFTTTVIDEPFEFRSLSQNTCESDATEVTGVIAFDFNGGAPNKPRQPAFQILRLNNEPIQFAIPFNPDVQEETRLDTPFIAIANSLSNEDLPLDVEIYELPFIDPVVDTTQVFRVLNWNRFPAQSVALVEIYAALDDALNSRFFPVGATSRANYPFGTIIRVPEHGNPCRTIPTSGMVEISSIDGHDGVGIWRKEIIEDTQYSYPNYPPNEAPDSNPNAGRLALLIPARSNERVNVEITELTIDGWLCFDFEQEPADMPIEACVDTTRVNIREVSPE